MTENTGTAAMMKATEALNRIDSHEDICALRYKSIDESTSRIEVAIAAMVKKQQADTTGIYSRFWFIAAGLFSCMFAVIMALVFK